MTTRSRAGFSLVELMVSVAIVGTLAALAAPNYVLLANRAKIGRAKADMSGLRAAAMSLRAGEDVTLLTAMNDSFFVLTYGLRYNATPVCPTLTTGLPGYRQLGYEAQPRDGWGQCYAIDQNEGEFADCRFDAIWSAGPDMVWSGPGDGDDVFNDDIIMRIPFYFEHPDCPNQSLDGQFGG